MRAVERRRGMGGASIPLPYDAEIEYIESTGTQRIDTGVFMTKSTKVELRLMSTKTSAEAGGDNVLFGAWTSNSQCSYAFMTGSNTVRVRWGSSNNYDLAVSKGDVLKFTYDGTRWTLLDETKNTSKSSTSGSNYSTNQFQLMQGRGCRFYYAKIGNLDLIPVRVGQVGYMYDRNSGTLYGNAGTGDFVLGNDKNS